MKDFEAEFALLIEQDFISGWSNTGDCYFRCFAYIEDLCDFIEDNLLFKEWHAHSEGLALNDLKRLRKEAIAVLERVRRGFLLEESERNKLNSIAVNFDFQIGWWGKFSVLVETQEEVAIIAQDAFWEKLCMDELDDDDDEVVGMNEVEDISTNQGSEDIGYIPKAKLADFQRFLNANARDVFGY